MFCIHTSRLTTFFFKKIVQDFDGTTAAASKEAALRLLAGWKLQIAGTSRRSVLEKYIWIHMANAHVQSCKII